MRLLALLLIAGCSAAQDALPPCHAEVPRECAAAPWVWARIGGVAEEIPAREYRADRCESGGEMWWPAVARGELCVAGAYWIEGNLVQLAWAAPMELWQTPLVHEFMHALQWRRDGRSDSEHLIASDWALVELVNEELRGRLE